MQIQVPLSVKGRVTSTCAVPSRGHTLVVTGRLLRTAAIYDEDWQDEDVSDPEGLLADLRSSSLRADLLTFAQKLPESTPRYRHPLIWDNVAAVRLAGYDEWWRRLPQSTRRNVRLAERSGVVTRCIPFDDDLVKGIKAIYDESPVRQGKRFWHYGKSLECVRQENGTYAGKAWFIGAFLGSELVGFLKMVRVGRTASIMQILALARQAEKRPTNALIAKAVETAIAAGLTHLVYCQYIYHGNPDSQLTEFKRRNGFEMILLPRYFIPLTWKGAVALRLGLHRGLRALVPAWLARKLIQVRARWRERSMPPSSRSSPAADRAPGDRRTMVGTLPAQGNDA